MDDLARGLAQKFGCRAIALTTLCTWVAVSLFTEVNIVRTSTYNGLWFAVPWIRIPDFYAGHIPSSLTRDPYLYNVYRLQLGPSLLPGLPLLVPEQPSEDLSRRTLRNNIDELDPSRQPLVPRLLLFYILGDAPLDHGVALFQPHRGRLDDERLGQLPGSIVLHGDNRAIGHGRMVE